jgi:hypothetical protein
MKEDNRLRNEDGRCFVGGCKQMESLLVSLSAGLHATPTAKFKCLNVTLTSDVEGWKHPASASKASQRLF